MRKIYDVIIVGAGPAGIFCALEISRSSKLKILMLDRGKGINERKCPAEGKGCRKCKPCNVLCGWGGAGAYSDGKLTLSPDIGGWLKEFVPENTVVRLIDEVDRTYREFGAPDPLFGTDDDRIAEIARQAVRAGLVLIPSKVRHMGTEVCPRVIQRMYEELKEKVEIRMETEVRNIRTKNGVVSGVVTSDGNFIGCRYLVVAPGRSGADWINQIAGEVGLFLNNNMVDIGVRVEVPAAVMEPLTSELYEPKLIYYSKTTDDRVRIFCMNPYGEVIKEYYEEVLTVNGHSYAEKKSDNTNFALLVDKRFTEPFHEPIAYGKYIASLANLLGDGIIVQRLGDLLSGRRSDEKRITRSTVKPTLRDATPGDLSLVLPFRYLSDILEMLAALDGIVPGVFSKSTLLYGVEVKFYSSRLKVSPSLESDVKNLYGAGDGVGVTRGLVQASASGILAARSILRRERKAKGSII